jgi:hypothetical protein
LDDVNRRLDEARGRQRLPGRGWVHLVVQKRSGVLRSDRVAASVALERRV